MPRTIDTEHNWYWQQGYSDGLDGLRAIAPDEALYVFQHRDYFTGYYTGRDARQQQQAINEELFTT